MKMLYRNETTHAERRAENAAKPFCGADAL